MPNKLVAVADIEGNFNAFAGLLVHNKITDEKFNWIFGEGHLILNGDLFDRGNNVLPLLWLIYKLEKEAEQAGGKVHTILGNHDIMNLRGVYNYNRTKYIKSASQITEIEDSKTAITTLYNEQSELGKWLRTKNTIEVIGDYLFVHAGLSPELLDLNLTIDAINRIVREHIGQNLYSEPGPNPTANLLMGRKGPFWFRGLVMSREEYGKVKMEQLDSLLNHFKAKKVVIGHSVVDRVSTDYDGKVIRIDILHGKVKNTGISQGLLVENGVEYVIDDLNEAKLLV